MRGKLYRNFCDYKSMKLLVTDHFKQKRKHITIQIEILFKQTNEFKLTLVNVMKNSHKNVIINLYSNRIWWPEGQSYALNNMIQLANFYVGRMKLKVFLFIKFRFLAVHHVHLHIQSFTAN